MLPVMVLAAAGMATAVPVHAAQDLPFSRGRHFQTLDEYLAYLKERGAMDIPYYEKQADGRYLYVSGRGAMRDPKYFTREQLRKKFGFDK